MTFVHRSNSVERYPSMQYVCLFVRPSDTKCTPQPLETFIHMHVHKVRSPVDFHSHHDSTAKNLLDPEALISEHMCMFRRTDRLPIVIQILAVGTMLPNILAFFISASRNTKSHLSQWNVDGTQYQRAVYVCKNGDAKCHREQKTESRNTIVAQTWMLSKEVCCGLLFSQILQISLTFYFKGKYPENQSFQFL